jgi:hypothetical protein
MEHDHGWYTKLIERIESEGVQNCTVHHAPPSPQEGDEDLAPADPDSYVSSSEQYEGMSFREYATQIEHYPDHHFDVIVVDGRARPSCFKHAVSKVKSDGLLVWDNTDREHYQPAMKLAPDTFEFRRRPGPAPFLNHFTETSLWKGKK